MAETKTEEKKEKWLNWLAITTILFSAAATLATFRGGGLSTRAVLNQARASDQWAYYQAKSVKGHTYQIQAEVLAIQSVGATGEQAQVYKDKIADFRKQTAKYEKDKAEISRLANMLEQLRDLSQANGAFFGVAIPYLQVAITLSALAALMKKRMIWLLGCGVGFIGLSYFLDGYWIWMASN